MLRSRRPAARPSGRSNWRCPQRTRPWCLERVWLQRRSWDAGATQEGAHAGRVPRNQLACPLLDKIQVPIAHMDADEFTPWWDDEARRLAAVIKRIGKIEPK